MKILIPKLSIISCVVFLFLIGFQTIGNTQPEIDWSKLSRSEKVGFALGWTTAGNLIGEPMKIVALRFGLDRSSRKAQDDLIKVIDGYSKQRGFALGGLALGQIVDTIDKLYSDPRLKQWEMVEIMPLVWGRLKGGWIEKDLDEVISYNIKWKEIHFSMDESEKIRKELRQLKKPDVLKALEKLLMGDD